MNDTKIIVLSDGNTPGVLTNTPYGWVFISIFEPHVYWGHVEKSAEEVVKHYLRTSAYKIYQFDNQAEFAQYLRDIA